jgi:transglutaminase-like putative cysteine protease
LLAAGLTLPTVHSIAVSNWVNDGLQVLVVVAFGGLVTGTLLALMRRFPAWLAHPLAIGLGVVWTVDRMPLMDPALFTWRDRATDLLIRTTVLGRKLASGAPGEDLLLFILVLSLLAWILAYATVWMLVRQNLAWLPVLLNGAVLFVNLTYAAQKPPAILFYVFIGAALLLFVHQTYLARWQGWSAAMLEVPDLLGWRFLLTGSVVVLLLLLGTQFFPTSINSAQLVRVWTRLRVPWEQVQSRWNQAFSTINASANATGGGFGATTLTLSGARTLGDALVMEVRSVRSNNQPFFDYWRATAYDQYNGIVTGNNRTWADTTSQIAAATLGVDEERARTPLDANARLAQIDTLERSAITQTYTLRQGFAQPTLFAATQPLTVSVPILAKHTFLTTDGQTVPNYTDLVGIATQNGGVPNGFTYDVVSLVGTAPKQSLRTAPTEYPVWAARYLQLPEGPQLDRVRARAAEVVGDANNAYDKAERIEAFLRTFTYDEQIPMPPPDRDGVDWFVFDLQRGYCDYFASSMVVMLRSVGVPARLVSGYAGGQLNPETGVYEVRQNVAHTWPEVYFPGYGWQRFEPTAASYTSPPARPESAENGADLADPTLQRGRELNLERLEELLNQQEGSLPQPEEISADIAALERAAQRAAWTRRGVAGASLGALLASGWWLLRRRDAAFDTPTHVYRRLLLRARLAGVPAAPSATPHEFVAQVAEQLPPQRADLNTLASAYARERYGGNQRTQLGETQRAWQAVRRPLWHLLFRRLFGGLRRGDQ